MYHFFHKLLNPFYERKGFEEDYAWYLDANKISQRLYLSSSAMEMLEVI